MIHQKKYYLEMKHIKKTCIHYTRAKDGLEQLSLLKNLPTPEEKHVPTLRFVAISSNHN